MARIVPLTTSTAGMTRLREKGGASPQTLYDLINGYITIAGTIKPRPGTFLEHTLPAGTKGLVTHKGCFHVFSHQPVTMTDGRFVCDVLRHPSDNTLEIAEIHFASPMMGFLYVVPEYTDGSIFHFWLESIDTWAASTGYSPGDRVFPTVPNGYAYKAKRLGSPGILWAEDVERAISDVVEPTVSNGFKYTVIAVTGANPASGNVEPEWPTENAATIIERTNDGTIIPPPLLGPDEIDPERNPRYGNPAGGFGTDKTGEEF